MVSIAVSPGSPELAEGLWEQLAATGSFSNGSTGDITPFVTWASATPSVATISSTGVATAQAPGQSAITASLAGVTSPADTLTVPVPRAFLVSNTGDSGPGSLRQAILDANAQQGASDITFDPAAFANAQTITLTSGQLELSGTSGTETITGPAAGVTVNAGGKSRVFQVDTGVTASISGLSITGGSARDGGGLYNDGGAITLNDCTISGNSASQSGGGLYNLSSGTATLSGCAITGNSVNAPYSAGGGVYNQGVVTLTQCVVSGNSGANGGGLMNYDGTATLTDSTISGNTSFHGAGIFSCYYAHGITTLANCTVSGNTASSQGGGVYTGPYGATTLTDSTVSGNAAAGNGGGLYSRASSTTTLTNCTVSGNSAGQNGGGLYWTAPATVNLGNTIVAGNTASTSGPEAFGTFTSQGNNLVSQTDSSSGWIGSDLTGTIAQPLNPLIAPLGFYGGPTETMALLPGSPAIDAGRNALIPADVTTDQRGLPRIVNGTVDIGAFESSGFTIAVTSGSGQTTGILLTAFNPLVATVTANNPIEPVAGGLVTFTAPASGPSAVISGSPAVIGAGGTASVTAASDGYAGSYIVSATASGVPVAASFGLTNFTSMSSALVSIAVSPGNTDLAGGFTAQFRATGTFANGSTEDITSSVIWASATPSVATIDATGLATTHAVGTSVITASLAGVTSPAVTLTVTYYALVTTTADSGPGSLRQAILDVNTVTGPTVAIGFAIPGAGVHTIDPVTPLPPITASVLVDGTSQPGFAGAAADRGEPPRPRAAPPA